MIDIVVAYNRWLDGMSAGIKDAADNLPRAVTWYELPFDYDISDNLALLFADGYTIGYDLGNDVEWSD